MSSSWYKDTLYVQNNWNRQRIKDGGYHARPNSDPVLQTLTCCCWKDLSLFLKREGSTKSHPLARKASSPLRSGSPLSDVSLIIMAEAEAHELRRRRIVKRPLKCGREANA